MSEQIELLFFQFVSEMSKLCKNKNFIKKDLTKKI